MPKQLTKYERDEQSRLNRLLDSEPESVEDLGIPQQDGSRACINYELAGQGFHLVPIEEMNRSYRK